MEAITFPEYVLEGQPTGFRTAFVSHFEWLAKSGRSSEFEVKVCKFSAQAETRVWGTTQNCPALPCMQVDASCRNGKVRLLRRDSGIFCHVRPCDRIQGHHIRL